MFRKTTRWISVIMSISILITAITSNFVVYADAGEELDFSVQTTFDMPVLTANRIINAKVQATNVSVTPYSGTMDALLIVALYDSGNTMVNVSYISKGIPFHGTENLQAGFKLPANVNGYVAKAFMWDGTDMKSSNMIPYSNAVEVYSASLTPTSSPTNTPTPTITNTPTPTATKTPTPTITNTPTPTATKTPTPTITNTPTPTATKTPTPTITNTPTPTATKTPTPTITNTPTPTATKTPTSTITSTPTPTATKTPTITSTPTPTVEGTPTPTASPVIVTDYIRPIVSLSISPTVVTAGQQVTITVNATDDIGVISKTLAIAGTVLTLDSSGKAVYTPSAVGIYSVEAKAKDAAGNEGYSSGEIIVKDPADTTAPQAAITTPSDWALISTATCVSGTVNDANLAYYKLEYSVKGKNEFVKFDGGNLNVNSGNLGTIDPANMKNGLYDLRLTACDKSGNKRSVTITILVESKLKKGIVNLSFNDLTVPATGISLDVLRTYNSKNKSTGDLGKGWTFDTTGIKLYKSCSAGDNWQLVTGAVFKIQETKPHLIIVVYPDGRMDKFSMTLNPNPFQISSLYAGEMVYRQEGGTKSTLTALDGASICYGYDDGSGFALWEDEFFSGIKYNPTRYQLTTKEGTVIVFNASGDVESIKDNNGNTITPKSTGLTHSNGRSLTYTRDASGRITKITDGKGNNVSYSYDSYGDLVSSKDPAGNVTKYIYNSNHDLVDIIDARNIRMVRNEYDSKGRLIATIDAGGNRTTYIHDDANGKETVIDRLGNSTVMEYDSKYNITAATDAMSSKTTYDDKGKILTEGGSLNSYSYTYDNNDNIASKTDAMGNNVNFTYNNQGKITTITDLAGKMTRYIYDSSGNLSETDDPLAKSIKFGHDGKGNLTSITDQLGKKVQYVYDAKGNLISQTDDSGKVMSFAYDENGRCVSKTTTVTTSQGSKTITCSDQYDAMGRVTQSFDAKGDFSKVEYNSIGKISAYINKLSDRTEYYYDIYGNLSQIKYSDGTAESFTYDAEGRNTSAVDREGKTINFEYDALGKVTKVAYPDGTYKTIEYDAKGNVTKMTDPRENYISYGYDAAGRNTTVTDRKGNVTTYVYTKGSNPDKMIDARNKTYTFTYDDNGRRTKTTFPDETTYSVSYDDVGRILSETDQAGKTTTYGYDYAGRLTSVKDALSNAWKYEYDEVGNLTKVTDPKLNETKYEYDNVGRLTKRTLPLGMSESMGYDAENRLVSKTDLNGKTITYTYDSNGRLTQKAYPDESIVSFAYNKAGYITGVTDSIKGTTTYQYNSVYGLVSQKNPDGTTISYSYDSSGSITEVKTAAGTTQYTYDELDRMKTASGPDGTTSYEYDSVGNRTGITYPNGIKLQYTYDDLNRLTRVDTIKGTETLSWYKYTLGAAGNRTKVEESTGRIVDYEYDDIYRLTKESIKNADGSTRIIAYTYDAVGNRLTKSDNGTVTSYTYDKNDRLTNEGSIVYTYDNNGNLTVKTDSETKTEYTYDFDNRLKKVKNTNISGITTEEYEYDWAGNRIQKKTNDIAVVKYLVDSNGPLSRVIEERDGSGTLLAYYTVGDGELISQKRGANISYYLYDGHGSVRALADGSGTITDTYTYDAFGVLLNKTGSTVNNYLYAGEQYDANTGFYYLRARYMNPVNGRFITMDPYAGSIFDPVSLHKYMYANASPVNFTDPTGYESLGELMSALDISSILDNIQCIAYAGIRNMLIGGIAGAVFGGVDSALGGARGWDIVNGAMSGALTGAEFGALATFAVMRPILIVLGLGSGVEGVTDSIQNGHYAQAAWRAFAVVSIVKSATSEFFDPTACFTGETLIYTKDGYKEIKDIKVGDEVYSENPATGEKGLKKVINVFVHEVHKLVHVKVDGQEIKTTTTHPFWVEGKGWTEAGDLKVGDRLKLYSGDIMEIKDVTVEYLQKLVKVYNFEVEDWHTYFVSDSNVFVHNASCGPEGKTITNSAGKQVQRNLVKSQDELLGEAEKAAGGSLDDFVEVKPGWWVDNAKNPTKKIEWEPAGHSNTNEGPHVTVREITPTGKWKVVDKIFIEGKETFK